MVPVESGGGPAAPGRKDCHPGGPWCGPRSLRGEELVSGDSTNAFMCLPPQATKLLSPASPPPHTHTPSTLSSWRWLKFS